MLIVRHHGSFFGFGREKIEGEILVCGKVFDKLNIYIFIKNVREQFFCNYLFDLEVK